MTAEKGQQLVEDRRPVELDLELGAEGGRSAEAVAKQSEIARTAASCGEPGQGAGEIGQGLERGADPLAPARVGVQPVDQ